MKTGTVILIVIGFFVAIGAIGYSVGWYGVGYTKTVGKAQENANREVFEQTQSYVEGKRQELTKLRLEYEEDTSKTDKEALKRMILSDFSNFDESKLPLDLDSFLQSLK